MPLDYSIWHLIVETLVESMPECKETKADFIKRLQKTAKTLPRGRVATAIGRMKKQIKAVVKAKGYHPKPPD